MNEGYAAIMLPAALHLIDGLIAIVIFIGIPWLVLHYIAKFRGNRQRSARDAQEFEHFSQVAARMEQRMATLERILDAEVPDWRQRNDFGVRNHETI